ncbi:MAG: riboflavin synthase [Actinomycetota bacterium]
MFTGIIEERGAVLALDGGRLSVACRVVNADSPIGASVAINGTCLTVVERDDRHLGFDLSQETVARTSLRRLAPGHPVNLERPVSLAARLGGHIVQGHVDGVGDVLALDPSSDGGALLRVRVPVALLPYVVDKGSIAIDGVSLTAAVLHDDGITIALVPHTLAVTTLGTASVGDPVNVEVDMIAKYVERLMERS